LVGLDGEGEMEEGAHPKAHHSESCWDLSNFFNLKYKAYILSLSALSLSPPLSLSALSLSHPTIKNLLAKKKKIKKIKK
jgi:hypothetical protein